MDDRCLGCWVPRESLASGMNNHAEGCPHKLTVSPFFAPSRVLAVYTDTCGDCKGTGKVALLLSVKTCPPCGGTGRVGKTIKAPVVDPANQTLNGVPIKSIRSLAEYGRIINGS